MARMAATLQFVALAPKSKSSSYQSNFGNLLFSSGANVVERKSSDAKT